MQDVLMLKLFVDKGSVTSLMQYLITVSPQAMGEMLWQRTQWSTVPLAVEEGERIIAEGPRLIANIKLLYYFPGTLLSALYVVSLLSVTIILF